MLRWYALFTKVRKEHQVAEALSAKGIETYEATVAVTTRRGKVERPFFPRYTFARIDLPAVGISAVAYTPGLTNVVAFNGLPAALPDPVIEHLKARLAGVDAQGYASLFRPGDRVRIVGGPFKDFEAVFDKALNGSDRVRILLDLLDRHARYEIEAGSITPISSPRSTSK